MVSLKLGVNLREHQRSWESQDDLSVTADFPPPVASNMGDHCYETVTTMVRAGSISGADSGR